MSNYISVMQAAQIEGVCRQAIYERIQKGSIEARCVIVGERRYWEVLNPKESGSTTNVENDKPQALAEINIEPRTLKKHLTF